MGEQLAVTERLLAYLRRVSLREDDVLAELRAETALLPGGTAMQLMPEQGQLLGLLAGLTGARLVLEIGTFTGYSTVCLARALSGTGRLVTCDLSPKWPAFGLPYWERAGVADRIEVMIGDARDSLAEFRARHGPGSVDFTFIDADKAGYRRYYDEVITLTRPGGLIALDNTLFLGRVADPAAQDPDTVAIRELNEVLHADDRVDAVLLTVADGLTLARRKPLPAGQPRNGGG
ncbi:O-methyltransferase [Amycolatopsis minnesotensis]|uniref:Class I SAM-dependent methyltransferase n=1 Tax=Amycolatopsis minnesotensis TaxID=337894 RepID=A0ABN2QX20_9PSEU